MQELGEGLGVEDDGALWIGEVDRAVGGEGDHGSIVGIDDDEGVGVDALVVGGDAAAGDEADGGEQQRGAKGSVVAFEDGDAGFEGGHGREATRDRVSAG